MIVYAVYVITDTGMTILAEHFHSAEDEPDEQLLGGLMTALQMVANEMSELEQEMRRVEIEGLTYHMKSFGMYQVVLVTDMAKSPDEILHALGMRFMREYGEYILGGMESRLDVFEPFRTIIRDVVKGAMFTDDARSLRPSKPLTTGEIFSLPKELHPTALALVVIREGTLEEIAKESEEDEATAEAHLLELQKWGLVGFKINNNQTIYFCSI